jgi:hypothetical protein
MAQSLTARPVDPQTQQFLDSYVRVFGHEPSSQEIAEFEARQQSLRGLTPFPTPTGGGSAPDRRRFSSSLQAT